MAGVAIALLIVCGVAILLLPRRWAPVALLVGTCYVTRGQAIEIGLLTFTIVRLLIAVGVFRVLLRTEWTQVEYHGLDRLILMWGALMVMSVAFHNDPSRLVVERLGLVFDAWGAYFLIRCFCRTWEEALGLCRLLGMILAPIAVEMIAEKATAHNYFGFLGGVSDLYIRGGHVRAQGPFAHAILAGTIGAVCLPLVLSVWRFHRSASVIGVAACLAIVVASTSSGPIMSAIVAIGALTLWPYRHRTRLMRSCAVLAYAALSFIMKDPPYYLMARIDLVGGSTGWHRARLIQSSFAHLSEWWLAGTDYTRHWMPTGVSWSPNHTDITNHYLQMGVLGGLPLMALFIAVVVQGFVVIGRRLRDSPERTQFTLWSIGASLFAHTATMISVSYFDQSAMFLYMTLALIGSAQADADLTVTEAERSIQPRRSGIDAITSLTPSRPVAHPQPARRSPERTGRRSRSIETPVGSL